jgi:hypothetical protein
MAKKKSQPVKLTKRPAKPVPTRSLLGDLRQLIEAAREQTARAVNSTLVTMYWQIGKRIREDVLKEHRAGYGQEIVSTLSKQLIAEYGKGFDRRNLFYMIRFAEVFPDEQIVNALRSQLSWTHFRELLPIDDVLKRDFYAELCRVERWSTRTLRHKIGHLLYERTAVSRKPEALIAKDIAALRDDDRLTPDMVFRDPYFLDFLGLSGPLNWTRLLREEFVSVAIGKESTGQGIACEVHGTFRRRVHLGLGLRRNVAPRSFTTAARFHSDTPKARS